MKILGNLVVGNGGGGGSGVGHGAPGRFLLVLFFKISVYLRFMVSFNLKYCNY